jgi:hypothetical protein
LKTLKEKLYVRKAAYRRAFPNRPYSDERTNVFCYNRFKDGCFSSGCSGSQLIAPLNVSLACALWMRAQAGGSIAPIASDGK